MWQEKLKEIIYILENSNVNVIHRLTRNAFIPIMFPFKKAEQDENPSANNFIISKNVEQKNNKHLSKYIFKYAGTYNLLSVDEIRNLDLSTIFFDPKGTSPPIYWHFLTDPRDIMDLYQKAGVKLLVNMDIAQKKY